MKIMDFKEVVQGRYSCKKFSEKLLVAVLRLMNVRFKDGSQAVA